MEAEPIPCCRTGKNCQKGLPRQASPRHEGVPSRMMRLSWEMKWMVRRSKLGASFCLSRLSIPMKPPCVKLYCPTNALQGGLHPPKSRVHKEGNQSRRRLALAPNPTGMRLWDALLPVVSLRDHPPNWVDSKFRHHLRLYTQSGSKCRAALIFPLWKTESTGIGVSR